MVAAEDKCRTVHNITALSFTTASVACSLSITTIATNALMMYVIYKGNRSRLRSSAVASGALVNTVIADLLTGILTDIIVTASHIIEGLQTSVRREILVAGHIVHFLTTGAALISVTLLSTDRIIALLFPIYYQNSKIRLKTWHMFLFTWTLSSLFLISYFEFGFIKHLAVYASINITCPAILMVFTVIAYREKFIKRTFSRRRTKSACSQVDPLDSSQNIPKSLKDTTQFLQVPRAFEVHQSSSEWAGNNVRLQNVAWSNSNTLPACTEQHRNGMAQFFPEIATPSETTFLQQLPKDRHHSEGALLPHDTSDLVTQRKPRSSSVRFLDPDLQAHKSKNQLRKPRRFAFFTDRLRTVTDTKEHKLVRQKRASMDNGSDSSVSIATSAGGNSHPSIVCKQKPKRSSRTDKRLMRALIINLCVFMIAYTPSICFIIYLNICINCNCTIVHILRDAVGLFVRLASLLRPLTFLVCTKSLRDLLKKLRKR